MRSFKSITPEFLESYLEYIHSKSGDVWVDTFSRVFEYMFLRSQTTVETRGFTGNSIDFVLHNNKQGEKLSAPLTVVVKLEDGEGLKSAKAADGHVLKAWPCAASELCIDVDTYDQNVHVQ